MDKESSWKVKRQVSYERVSLWVREVKRMRNWGERGKDNKAADERVPRPRKPERHT